MTSTLIICTTCAFSREEKHRNGQTGGEILAALVEDALAGLPADTPAPLLRRHACLMGCDHPCNVAVAADGKLTYVLGRFAPDSDSAEAIVSFARHHGTSTSGQVPFRDWPQGVKGHFIARIPPLSPATA
jgi:predicted metal-binding protein